LHPLLLLPLLPLRPVLSGGNDRASDDASAVAQPAADRLVP
jgi:hypothetical protein